MREHISSLTTCVLLLIGLNLNAQNYTLDFSKGDNVDGIVKSNVELIDAGFDHLFSLPSGTYKILLDKGNQFSIPVDRGELRLEEDNKKEVRKLVLYTKALSLEGGFALTEAFHKALNLPLDRFYAWAKPVEDYKYPRDFYGNGIRGNHPELSMSIHTSFNKDIPFFITYHFTWDNKVSRRRGTSAESNKLQSFTFDVPAILASVTPQASESPTIEEKQIAEPAGEVSEERKPVEVIFDQVELPEKPAEEKPEQSSQWWLWLVGALVVVGGLVVVVRRKS